MKDSEVEWKSLKRQNVHSQYFTIFFVTEFTNIFGKKMCSQFVLKSATKMPNKKSSNRKIISNINEQTPSISKFSL